jgi:hypothetical protein
MSAVKLISINVLIISASALMVVLALMLPSKWDKAVALKICRDGTPILRLQDGSIWARRNGFIAYRVENEEMVC